MNRVFVYGTLKRGGMLHGALADSKFLGCAKLGGYTMLHLGAFPGIVENTPKDKTPRKGRGVYGEVFEVTEETLGELDQIECTPSLYRRNLVSLEPDEEAGDESYRDEGQVETYIYNQPYVGFCDDPRGVVEVVSGRWSINTSVRLDVEELASDC